MLLVQVLYNHLLTARIDELQHNHGVVLKRIGNVQREAAMAFDEIAKVGHTCLFCVKHA